MDSHIRPEKVSQIAEGNETLSSDEFQHLQQCSECVDAVANRIRLKYDTQPGGENKSPKSAGGDHS
jgi:hypothetical protein